MNAAYFNAIRDHGQSIATHVGLVDDLGIEITGGNPAYARIAESWVDDGDGVSRLAADRTFNIPAGVTVGGWRAYSALSGGTDFGGAVVTNEAFANQGEYTLLAAATSITHQTG